MSLCSRFPTDILPFLYHAGPSMESSAIPRKDWNELFVEREPLPSTSS